MGEVIHIEAWRAGPARRSDRSGTAFGTASLTGRRPIATSRTPHIAPDGPVARLERAVGRIDRVTARVQARGGHLAADVETELLALVGQISLGLVDEAATRAEHLADMLGGASSSGS